MASSSPGRDEARRSDQGHPVETGQGPVGPEGVDVLGGTDRRHASPYEQPGFDLLRGSLALLVTCRSLHRRRLGRGLGVPLPTGLSGSCAGRWHPLAGGEPIRPWGEGLSRLSVEWLLLRAWSPTGEAALYPHACGLPHRQIRGSAQCGRISAGRRAAARRGRRRALAHLVAQVHRSSGCDVFVRLGSLPLPQSIHCESVHDRRVDRPFLDN